MDGDVQVLAGRLLVGVEPLVRRAVLDVLERRNYQRGLTAYMPQLIAELEAGITATYEGIVNGELPPSTPPEPSELQQAVTGRIASLPYSSLIAK